MRWSLAFVFFLGLVISKTDSKHVEVFLGRDVANRNAIIENQLRGLLEDLRQTMISGSDTIPVLDPLEVTDIQVDESVIPLPGLSVLLNNVKVSKLSTFVVEDLTVQIATVIPLRYGISFNLQVPELEIDVDEYDLRVSIDTFTLFGKGDGKINLIKPRISGHVLARFTFGFFTLFLNLEEVSINIDLEEFDPHINGLLGGDESVGAFINTFLKFFIPGLLELYEEDITNTVSDVVQSIGNDLLADMNLFDILG